MFDTDHRTWKVLKVKEMQIKLKDVPKLQTYNILIF
jgi:hypothetical protein